MRNVELVFLFLGACMVWVALALPYGWLVANDPFIGKSSGMSYTDLVSIQLTALIALLSALGIGIAGLAIWGYREFMSQAQAAAHGAATVTIKNHLESESFKAEVKATLEIIHREDAEAAAAALSSEAPPPPAGEPPAAAPKFPDAPPKGAAPA